MEVTAKLKYVKVGTQKARLVADLVRGKDVNRALQILGVTQKKSAPMIKKLIESAVANADQKKVIDLDGLYIKTITVDQAPFAKRFMPRAQGRAFQIKKKSSHINVVLDER